MAALNSYTGKKYLEFLEELLCHHNLNNNFKNQPLVT